MDNNWGILPNAVIQKITVDGECISRPRPQNG